MIRTLVLFLFSINTWAAPPAPTALEEGTDVNYTVRHFHKIKKLKIVSEYSQIKTEKQSDIVKFQTGLRYRLSKNFKIGAYYSRMYGNRHDEDWIASNGSWKWKDTKDRGENIFTLDLIPRFLLKPNVIGEFRVKVLHNTFNSNTTLKIRPSLSYVHLGNAGPIYTASLRYEVYIPMSYGDKFIYEDWAYVDFLYHYKKWFKPSVFFSVGNRFWTQTDKFAGAPYEARHKIKMFGVQLIFLTK